MQHKLCLWLAALLLLGALGVGNPFLVGPACAGPAEPASSSPKSGVSPRAAGELHEPRFEVDPPPRAQTVALSVPGPSSAGANRPLRPSVAPAFALASDAPTPQTSLACPDAKLQHLVLRVDFHEGKPVWVLRDGRRLARNPKVASGEPRLVPIGTAAD